MHATRNSRRKAALIFTTGMAAVLLSGCAAGSAPHANASASSAQTEMARGRPARAIEHAEAAVQADPNNPAYRLLLGNAYLDAGRFASAETALNDAMTLGDTSARTALALALAEIAQAKYAPATALLGQYDGQIGAADLGLALALAGQPERAIHIMSNAIRAGENTVKMRQNLAYAYAMAGRWREARLMAQQDVPAGEVGQRMEQWAAMVPADAYEQRVAGLLGAPTGVRDTGLPAHLALGNNPSAEQLMAEAATSPMGTSAPHGELAAVSAPQFTAQPFAAQSEPVAAPVPSVPSLAPAQGPSAQDFASAFAAPARPAAAPELAAQETRHFISEPVVQSAPHRAANRPEASRPVLAANGVHSTEGASGTHLVQLGSFLTEQGAQRAWDIYQSRYPELSDRELVITEAMVNGRRYWRVSAGGFSQNASRNVCSRVRSAGGGCVTWAEGRPLPGAVDRGVRFARR